MELVINDIKAGDIYEHEMGGIYEVTEVNKSTRVLVSHRVNSSHPKDEFHDVDQIKNFYGKFR